ncbi:hypothetical protein VTI74DRAFT_3533 [Chaetomium olivicolor]
MAGNSGQPAPSDLQPRVIFSGIQPTGIPHLGNYLGALREWKRLQDEAEPGTALIIFIADLHAMTVPRSRQAFMLQRYQMLAALLAIGLDPERCTIFMQSDVPSHAELQWILSCSASMGYLSRMTQWKSKLDLKQDASLESQEVRQQLKLGLFSYPVLQAADILVYRATHVPVGEDQRQHLEFTRECVTNFNHTYNTNCLVAPQTLLSPSRRVMSLTNPKKKMSKSDPSPKSRILLTDPQAEIEKKIMKAVTDSLGPVTYDPDSRPGVSNLLEILAAFDPQRRSPIQLAEEMRGCQVSELKGVLAHVLREELGPIREKFEEYYADRELLDSVRRRGAEKADRIAKKTMMLVRDAVGLGYKGL